MRNVWIIFRKEMRSYFVSPVAYVLLGVFGLIIGFIFWNRLALFIDMGIQMQMSGQSFPMSLNEEVIRPLLETIGFIGLFFIPFITMRVFTEEKRNGTMELLATSPIRDLEMIIAKWLAAVALYACLLLFTALNFFFLFRYGNPDWKPLVIGYLGLLLQAGSLLAIGTLISSMTRNTIVALAVSFAVCLLLWIVAWPAGYESAAWAQVLSYMSVITHFESFAKGVFETKDVIFYASLIFFSLFLTSRSMESVRWRS